MPHPLFRIGAVGLRKGFHPLFNPQGKPSKKNGYPGLFNRRGKPGGRVGYPWLFNRRATVSLTNYLLDDSGGYLLDDNGQRLTT